MYKYKFQVTRVIDGDTVEGIIDLGLNIKSFKRVRLFGINAPETRTLIKEEKIAGFKSKNWLIERLENDVVIHTHKDTTGKYGLLLGTLFVDDVDVNQEMILLGLAREY